MGPTETLNEVIKPGGMKKLSLKKELGKSPDDDSYAELPRVQEAYL